MLVTHNSITVFIPTNTHHIGPEKFTWEKPWVGFRLMHLVHPYSLPWGATTINVQHRMVINHHRPGAPSQGLYGAFWVGGPERCGRRGAEESLRARFLLASWLWKYGNHGGWLACSPSSSLLRLMTNPESESIMVAGGWIHSPMTFALHLDYTPSCMCF